MIVKKFQADTETDAILKAKEELGSGAVVLNVKTLKQRGIFRLFKKDVVEVTAALEEKEGKTEQAKATYKEGMEKFPESERLQEKAKKLSEQEKSAEREAAQ